VYTLWYLNILQKGQDGERDVRRELEKLPQSYTILYDFSFGKKGNTDLVVVGPSGVWSIEVKDYKTREITFKNNVLCNESGKPLTKNALAQSYAEAKNIEKYLLTTAGITIPVHPLLVFSSLETKVQFGNHPVLGVQVVGIALVNKLLQESNMSSFLSSEQCLTLKTALSKQTSVV
jgi:hypothetical protein